MKIAFLIPCKSDSKWLSLKDSLLYKKTLSSFTPEKQHKYFFYIGYDHDDLFYFDYRKELQKAFPTFNFRFVEFPQDVRKGHLTRMWNILYNEAMREPKFFIDYFYQCGDDIIFKSSGWVQDCINELKKNGNVGIAGPKNDHPYLLTQAMVSRIHYSIFKFLFPEYIFNWGCDDWINVVYQDKYKCILNHHFCENSGGAPRYETKNYNIISLKKKVGEKANQERSKLNAFLAEKIHIS